MYVTALVLSLLLHTYVVGLLFSLHRLQARSAC